MIPAAFEYKRASSADEAISLISQYGDEAKFLAGGHSLIPLMKLRLAQPTISGQIRALEHQLGEKLFQRAGRNRRPPHASHVLPFINRASDFFKVSLSLVS